MKRWLFLLGLILVSTSAFAQQAIDLPSFFQPAEEDLSVWYLGNIFGSELIPGSNISDIRLLSVLFGIFNQVVLVVGIIIIVYTVLAGTLNTANEGKPLGEKWNSVWMPVRISAGIALLVPKGGTGYCMAQYLVMWLTLQGIGAADTIWSQMVNYFAEGGAIYAKQAQSNTMFITPRNVDYTFLLQLKKDVSGSKPPGVIDSGPNAAMLDNMVCIYAHNNNAAAVELAGGAKYSVYTIGETPNTVFFGNRQTSGTECGRVINVPPNAVCGIDGVCTQSEGSDLEQQRTRERIYTMGLLNMAKGLEGLAREIAENGYDNKDNSQVKTYEPFAKDVRRNAELFINYIVGYQSILDPNDPGAIRDVKYFKTMERYGWILAGNYYTNLSAYKSEVDYLTRKFVTPIRVIIEKPENYKSQSEPYNLTPKFAQDFVSGQFGPPYAGMAGFDQNGVQQSQGGTRESGKGYIGIVNMDDVLTAVAKGAGSSNNATSATKRAVRDFIRYLTGAGGGSGDYRVAKDPILTAANYGKDLMYAAFGAAVGLAALLVAASTFQVCKGIQPGGSIAHVAMVQLAGPPLLALMLFLYTQGAVLGVFIPLIPYITFFVGVIGWMLQVVESIAAAPLVAIGLVFPETRDDIWGRAAPAYMLILNLFLRPSLMLIGFAAAMIMMWVVTELLNIGFLMLTSITFRVDDVFGFVVIMMAYTAIFTVAVTKVYSLINVVPNKVLHWIGDQSMGVQGAEEAIGSAKQATEAGAGAVTAGAGGATQKPEFYKAKEAADQSKERGAYAKAGGGATPPPDNQSTPKENTKSTQSEAPTQVQEQSSRQPGQH